MQQRKQKRKWKFSYRESGLAIFLVILCFVFYFMNDRFLTGENLLNMIRNASLLGILSVGMMMIIITGGIDLSVGAMLALSGMASALVMRDHPEMPVLFIVLIGILVGALCGVINGTLIAKGGIIPIIATLGMMNVYRGLAFIISGGSWVSAHEMTDEFMRITTGSIGPVNNLIVIYVLVLIVFFYFLNYTKNGRYIYAVGSNPESAVITGIKKNKVIIMTYTLSGVLVGLTGVLWVGRFASAQPDTATGYEINVIAACVLGGASVTGGSGKISGLVLGVLLLGILQNALPLIHVSAFWQNFIRGIIILSAVLINVMIKRRADRMNLRRRVIETA